MAARAARNRLQQLYHEGIISATTWERLSPDLDDRIQTHLEAQQTLLRDQPELQAEELEDARQEGLRAQRAMLATLLSDGLISDQVYEELVTEVDLGLKGEVEQEEAT